MTYERTLTIQSKYRMHVFLGQSNVNILKRFGFITLDTWKYLNGSSPWELSCRSTISDYNQSWSGRKDTGQASIFARSQSNNNIVYNTFGKGNCSIHQSQCFSFVHVQKDGPVLVAIAIYSIALSRWLYPQGYDEVYIITDTMSRITAKIRPTTDLKCT